jgi:hypothetical protein
LTVCLTGGSNLTLDTHLRKQTQQQILDNSGGYDLTGRQELTFEIIFVVNRTRHGYHSVKIGLFRSRCEQKYTLSVRYFRPI